MKQIIDIVDDKPKEEETYGFNTSEVLDKDAQQASEESDKVTRKRGPGRPPKNPNPYSVVPVNSYTDIGQQDKKKKETYETQLEHKYAPQVGMIATIINQTDALYSNVEEQLNLYRTRQGYGGKSRNLAMTELQNTQVSLINTKLAAVRELNNMRHKITEFNMKNTQINKENGDENSDKAVMDSYYALINATRYGLPTVQQPLHPSSINTGVNLTGQAIATSNIGVPSQVIPAGGSTGIVTDTGIVGGTPTAGSVAGLDPIQQRMVLEKNPNIKTVVVYNQATGTKRFEVIDVTTGRSVPGVQRPADFLLDDMRVDYRAGKAMNTNTNMAYPLVVEGTKAFDEL